jgi:raffinose/stachyose/melibiose transport system permease protein
LENKTYKILKYIFLSLFLILMFFPIFSVINISLKNTAGLYNAPFAITLRPHFENFQLAWVKGHIGIYLRNSLIVTIFSQIFVVFLSSMGAFALSRRDTFKKLDKFLYIFFLVGIIIPPQVAIIPLYLQLNSLHLLNSLVGLILVYVSYDIPFGIFIMYSFFVKIPQEIEDAAKIDGCSNLGLYFRIIIPLSRSAIITVIIFSSVWIWNNLLFPLVFLSNDNLRTLPIGLLAFRGRFLTDYPTMFAGVVLSSLPLMIAFLALQNQFMRGITAGSVKG